MPLLGLPPDPHGFHAAPDRAYRSVPDAPEYLLALETKPPVFRTSPATQVVPPDDRRDNATEETIPPYESPAPVPDAASNGQ